MSKVDPKNNVFFVKFIFHDIVLIAFNQKAFEFLQED